MADTYTFTGTCKWAKLVKPDAEYDKTKHSWKIDLYMDDKSWSYFDQSGIQIKVRKDDAGEKYVTFKRPTEKLMKDKWVSFSPPEVLGKDGKKYEGSIGNGSKVSVKVEVYNTAKGKGHTLLGVRVDDLVEYNTGKDYVPDGVVPF